MDNGPSNWSQAGKVSSAPGQSVGKSWSEGSWPSQGSREEEVNVGDAERQASVIGGSMLALVGVLRGSLSGLVLVALGGALVYRGITGHCHMYEAMGHSTADQSQSTGASWTRS